MAPTSPPEQTAAALPAPLDIGVFRQMADMSNDAFYLCDADGRFLYVNERASAMAGYSRGEMLRMTVPDINPDFPPERFREFVSAMAPGSGMQFETNTRRKDGRIFPGELSVARIDVGDDCYLFGVIRDITERKQMEAAQKSFTQRILQTLEAERERVARELHDDVGQAIATVGVLLHSLERTPSSVPEEARPALEATQASIRQITESVARIVRDYHPAELLGLGLEDTVRSHAQQFAHRHGLTLRLTTAPVEGLLSSDQELHLYRIAQEALANVARHARANQVAVRLACERRRVVLTVRDDGIGFTPAKAHGGLGLVTMRERAALLGAELTIGPAPRRGTEVRISVPLDAQQAGADTPEPPPLAPQPERQPRPPRRRRAKLSVV